MLYRTYGYGVKGQDKVNASTYVSADGSRLTDTTIIPTFLQLRAMLETKF